MSVRLVIFLLDGCLLERVLDVKGARVKAPPVLLSVVDLIMVTIGVTGPPDLPLAPRRPVHDVTLDCQSLGVK